MNLEFKCAICGRLIENPIIGKYTCGDKACEKEYNRFLNRANYVRWRNKHKPKWKDKYKRKTICHTNQGGINHDKIQVGA